MLKFKFLTLSFAIALIGPMVSTSNAQCIPGSDKSFSRVKPGNVGGKLNELDLFNCLNFLKTQSDDSCTELALLFNQVFTSDPENTAAIDKLLKKIEKVYPKAISELEKLNSEFAEKNMILAENAKISSIKLRVLYAYVLTAQPIDIERNRIVFTIASPKQIQRVLNYTEKAKKLLSEAKEITKKYISELEAEEEDDPERAMIFIEPAENITRLIAYREIPVYTFSALAQCAEDGSITSANSKKITDQLKKCTEYLDSNRFADFQQVELNEWKSLICSMLGDYKSAIDAINKAYKLGANREFDLFCRCTYETKQAVKYLKDGKTADADNFFKKAAETVKVLNSLKNGKAGDESNEFSIDWKIVVLDFNLYSEWAKVLQEKGDELAAEKKSDRAIKDFVDLMMEYRKTGDTGRIYMLWTVLEPKLKGKDFKATNPVMRMFQGTMKYSAGEKKSKTTNEEVPEVDAAIKIFEKVIEDAKKDAKNKDSENKELYNIAIPGCYWYLGLINVTYKNKIDNEKAVHYFRSLAKEFPKDPNAYRANELAIFISRTMIRSARSKKKILPLSFYIDLDKSIGVMIKNFKSTHPEVEKMLYQRAENALDISRLASKKADKNKWRDAAIKYFNDYATARASDNSAQVVYATYNALELEYQKYMDSDTAIRKKTGEALCRKMINFASDMQANIRDINEVYNQAQKNYFRDAGSLMAYYSAWIFADIGKDRRARTQLEDVLTEWKGAPAASKAQAFLIQLNLQAGEVQKAVAQFADYEKKSGEKEATSLMFEIVTSLQEKINDPSTPAATLKKLKPAFIKFAKKVYDSKYSKLAAQENPTLDQVNAKNKLILLYAEALILKGTKSDATKALEILKPAQEGEQKRKEGYYKANKIEYKKHNQDVEKNCGNLKEAKKAILIYQSCKANLSSSFFNNMKIVLADKAVAKVRKLIKDNKGNLEAASSPEIEVALKRLKDCILYALPALEKAHNLSVDENAEIVMIEARALSLQGKWDDAGKIYRSIFEGMVPDANSKYQYNLYWTSVAGYIKSQIELAREKADPSYVDEMNYFIKLQKRRYPAMGGERSKAKIEKYEKEIKLILNPGS